MEMECEETAIESHLPVTPCETLNANETVKNHVESETCETNQMQSNLLTPTEESCNLTNAGICLESGVTPNKTDLLTFSQSHVSISYTLIKFLINHLLYYSKL